MNLHEYQAKALFKAYGMPVPNYIVANTAEKTRLAAEKLGTDTVVVKAQVHGGGRGKAGGVKLVDTPREAEDYAKAMLGTRLVTAHSNACGQPVNLMLVEETCDVGVELYLSVVIDATSSHVVVMASTEGGVDIKKVASERPEKIMTATFDPQAGISPDQCHDLANDLGLTGTQLAQFKPLLTGLCKLFVEKDLALVEINPLVVTRSGELVCLDGKINVDSNALHRHNDLQALRDKSQEN